eukprot:TRINITY_DN28753_c0_g1_i1.p2 TRINITY_DN28753_c0_g1~~TRINITY_DN28753_c0_g1_i1.p2  ORF type:complete len:208 (+),score=67.65 TRINITY_DN28753_c0_g1_i1:87-626(+)
MAPSRGAQRTVAAARRWRQEHRDTARRRRLEASAEVAPPPPPEDAPPTQGSAAGGGTCGGGGFRLVRRAPVDRVHKDEAEAIMKLVREGSPGEAMARFDSVRSPDLRVHRAALSAVSVMRDSRRAVELLESMHAARLPRHKAHFNRAMFNLTVTDDRARNWRDLTPGKADPLPADSPGS